MPEFEFKKLQGDNLMVKYLVDGLVPAGQLLGNYGQAQVGKSFLTNGLALSVACEKPFMGRDVKGGDVLIIDQDTPEGILTARLNKFARYFDFEMKHKLHICSMEGLTFKKDSLAAKINSYPDAILVVIDCLHGICGHFDPNKTHDMSEAMPRFKAAVARPDLTVMFNHHISEKNPMEVQEYMTCNPRALAMGSSVINQQTDGYYILSSPDLDGILRTLYVRPISRRTSIPMKPFIASLVETTGYAHWEYLEVFEGSRDALGRGERAILDLADRYDLLNVDGVYEMLGSEYSREQIRVMLKSLEIRGFLKWRRGRSNKYIYQKIEGGK